MKGRQFIGIDVSKSSLDVCIHSLQAFAKFDNNERGIKMLIEWLIIEHDFKKQSLFFVFEHTGLYAYQLAGMLDEQGLLFSIKSGLELRLSLGIQRGKTDKLDAQKIALYAYRRQDELEPTRLASKTLRMLKSLLSLRERMVKQRAGYKASLKEMKQFLNQAGFKIIHQAQQKMIDELGKQIKTLEQELLKIIKADQTLKQQFELLQTIKGIGPQTAYFLIVTTQAFTKFSSARKFASYSGIAPFAYQSGSSINGRNRVSHLANKKLKSLLQQCALSAIKHDQEMRVYYLRRLEKGKHKMSTINVIKNKLVTRAFAVIKRKSPYVDIGQATFILAYTISPSTFSIGTTFVEANICCHWKSNTPEQHP